MNLEVYVNGDHPVFREFGRDPRDYAIMEIAQVLRALTRNDPPITAIAAEVTYQFPDQRTTASALNDRAEDVIRRIRDLAGPIIAAQAPEMWATPPTTAKPPPSAKRREWTPHWTGGQPPVTGGSPTTSTIAPSRPS